MKKRKSGREFVSEEIRSKMHTFKRTGQLPVGRGKTRPKSFKEALRIAAGASYGAARHKGYKI